MLIDYDLFDTIQTGFIVGFLGAAVLLLIVAFWKKRFRFAAGAALALLLSVASIMLPDSFTTVVFEVTGAHDIAVKRAQLIGSRTYRFANGVEAELRRRPQPEELVVNDTGKALQIKAVAYGAGNDTTAKPVTIAPFSTFYTTLWIQYFGQGDHQPPSTIESESYAETRYWLTWE
ncbi:MAG: hypothetical protein KGL11_02415 [Alphaproteobacteria bacterium]|nr:hypothetical protein [Alphaproteobacteria bacterium]